MGDVFVRLLEGMPPKVPGMTILDDNGDYNVYISTELSQQGQREVLEHEMAHIQLGHFFDDRPIAELEAEADQAADKKEEQPTKELPVIYCA
jgi:hypothetical protein